MYLAAGEPTCIWFFCSFITPYGIRIHDEVGESAFLTSAIGASPLPGSLPMSRFPGNFVDANAAGVVATTQVAADTQFSALIKAGQVTLLEDINWLVGINDLPEPMALGYRGQAECAVYGCVPDPDECEEAGDAHEHQKGKGHEEHGQGNGYGHDPCHRANITEKKGNVQEVSVEADPQATGEVVVVQLTADGVRQYRVDSAAGNALPATSASNLFPLAINNQTLVLRGDVVMDGLRYHQQLLRCDFDPLSLDADNDGALDCITGIEPLYSPDNSLRFQTVLGFALNNAGMLTGNLGFTTSGMGVPVVMNINQDSEPDLLANHINGHGDWVLNALTDINASADVVGFGFSQCSDQPDAWFANPVALGVSDFGFALRSVELDTRVPPGATREWSAQARGGSGAWVSRYHLYDPMLGGWQLLQDWGTLPVTLPASAAGTVLCLREEIADLGNPDDLRQRVIRLDVSDGEGLNSSQPADTDLGIAISDALPALGASYFLAGLMLGAGVIRRRRYSQRSAEIGNR